VDTSQSPILQESAPTGNVLSNLPESETLRGVYIAGFNFGADELSRSRSGYDDSECSIKQEDISHDLADMLQLSVEHCVPEDPDKGITMIRALESDHVTCGNVCLDAHSVTTSEATSTGLYSCTSFGELRDCLPSTGHSDRASTDASDAQLPNKEEFQSNRAEPPITKKPVGESICPVHGSEHSRQGSPIALGRHSSLPTPMPPSILRRDTTETVLSCSTSRFSDLGNIASTSRPSSAMSSGLGGTRGLRLRKYASLNFDLDTVTSLESNRENVGFWIARPQSLSTTRRVSFVDSLNDDLMRSKEAGNIDQKAIPPAPLSAPIGVGGGHAWGFKGLNNFRATASSQMTPLHLGGRAEDSGISSGQNKLKKKLRTTSTPALSTIMTPRLQDKVELPEGLKQIGLGIGYTHTPSRVTSPHVSYSTAGTSAASESWMLRTPRTPTSMAITTAPRRAVSIIGTTNAIQRCASIFAGLRSKQTNTATSDRCERMDAVAERASEESDGLEAVMREMYGASWTAEGGSPSRGHGVGTGSGVGVAGGKKPGKVYTVPRSENMSETLIRAQGRSTAGSTLRLVVPAEDDGQGRL
jgi:hypothetical protein